MARPISGLRGFLRFDSLDLSRVISSNIISANSLFYIRLVVSLHLVAVFIATLYVSARDHIFYTVPTTFTGLSNIGLTAYYLTATYHSYSFMRHKDLRSLTSQHWFLSSAIFLLYATVVVFHIVVPAIYWSLLFDPNNTMDTVNKYVDFSHHGADLACILLEMIFNRMELPWVYILAPITMIILYMFLAWVYFSARGEWLYSFLDWSKGPVAAGWYLGLLCLFAIIFILQKYIHSGRDTALKRRRSVVASHDGTGSVLENKPSENADEEESQQQDFVAVPLGDQKEPVPESNGDDEKA
ncbi:hypothetical protein BGZ99_009812 [Dissophora globulifera]|uniref:FAR-17a/AIG1-like protein n=1 Tax=Dissophora globulifera TaxID=979702 RepID=A0A9P6RT27_9FUNG|nr:hypothetical protein BGZ99_009812 [Dissophora globulifera]